MSDSTTPPVTRVTASQSTLDVIRLPAGEEEPEGEDYVSIAPHPSGGYEFSGVVAIRAEDVVAGSSTSVSGVVGSDGPYAKIEAAEAAAVEWAAEQGAETLYILANDREMDDTSCGRRRSITPTTRALGE